MGVCLRVDVRVGGQSAASAVQDRDSHAVVILLSTSDGGTDSG